jgi:hypothetical protein
MGLKNYPEGDKQLKEIAIEMGRPGWKNPHRTKIRERPDYLGKNSPRNTFFADGVTPRLYIRGPGDQIPGSSDYIHRRQGDMDIYFVVNRSSGGENRIYLSYRRKTTRNLGCSNR